jgi:uncharacterized damage-inducible protein DinB
LIASHRGGKLRAVMNQPAGFQALAAMLTSYKAWANEIVYSTAATLPEAELLAVRPTTFKTIASTLNHVYVVDRIFQAHLRGTSHEYTARNTPTHPPLPELWEAVKGLDRWYLDYAAALPEAGWSERVAFTFVGGGEGEMSRLEILLHLVNHATYHRGFVGDMFNQSGVFPRASDQTVFLRDVWNRR